ncbi:MAG: D-alanyl-D-alanine carboxypeptidase, partial [Candidatus Pelagibacter sp.]
QGNRNPLLYKNIGADGIKTGYLAVERYSLASSLERNGRRLVAVGSGFETKNLRSKESFKLLTYGLTNFDLIEIAKSEQPFANVDIWLGKKNVVKVYSKENIYKTIKKGQKKLLKVKMIYDGPIEAPIKKDQTVAKLKIIYDQDLIGEYDLLALTEVKKVNIFSRLLKSLNYLIWGDV